MSKKRIDTGKLILYSSSSRQRRNTTISPNIDKNKKIGDYLLLSTIGRGTFSKVKLGLHLPTKQKVAIKILNKEKINDEADIERIRREIHILSMLRHPNIVQLYETMTNDNNIYIIMEYVEGKDLFQFIYSMQRLTEFKSSQLFRQLISCLEYIHKLGIVHRDIKPENILLNKNKKNLKLVDFGLSNTYEKDELIKTACGSPCYAAPEMISGKDYEGFYSDLWSCGVVLYCMLVGKLPFDDEDIKRLYHNIKIANYVMPNFLSRYAQDILRRILVTNPKRRIKLEELKKHPFLLMSEKTPMYKGIIISIDEIPVDYDIVQNMKDKYFNSEEYYNINCDIIIENIKNNLHNKITTIYYLMLKMKYKDNPEDYILKNKYNNNDNNSLNDNNIENKDNNINNTNNNDTINLSESKRDEEKNKNSEKSPTFVKNNEEIDKSNNIIIMDKDNKSINQTLAKSIDINSSNNNFSNKKNSKKINIHNIKKILFTNTNKKTEKNSNTQTNNNSPKNNQKENLSINNDNNEKRFNILVINNFMSDKESPEIDNYNSNLISKIDKKNKSKKNNENEEINSKNINKDENDLYKTRRIIIENSKNKNDKDIIINRIINNNNKNNPRNMKKIHSVKYNQKKRIKSLIGNSIKIDNFTVSINQTNNNINSHINKIKEKYMNFSNSNKINKINKNYLNKKKKIIIENNNKIFGMNTMNLKPFKKCKKINFGSLEYNKINDNINNLHTNINEIKNDNIHRHNYILSKVYMNKPKNLNKSINLANNQRNGNNKFKKYIKKLFEEESLSINNDFYESKSLNITPLFHSNISKNKIYKNYSINNKKTKENNNMIFNNIVSDFSKFNKTINIIDLYKTNEIKNYNKSNIINNINKKNINLNKLNNISSIKNDNFIYNIKLFKKNNLIKNKNDFEEKMKIYIKQRFKNCIKKKYSKDKINNLYIKIDSINNYEKNSKSNSKSPHLNISKFKSESCSNKSYLKYNNRIFINKNNLSFKNKNVNINNITKNNSSNKNKKIKNNININTKNNNNFLFAADFSNVIKKNISPKKNIKKKNFINLNNNYNFILKNNLMNIFKNNFYNDYSKGKQSIPYNKEYNTTYHSRNKSKEGYDMMKFSPLNNNNKILNIKAKSITKKNGIIFSSNFNEFNILNNSKAKTYFPNNRKYKKIKTPLK